MVTSSQPDPQSRIRDNQRRSRARRKEYLQELETKYRTCEQIGAEASAEIQAAARKVAEENRRLRVLLQSHGIPDPDLALAQQGQDFRDMPLSDDARMLGAMLITRRSCGGDSSDLRRGSAPPGSSRVPMPVSPVENSSASSQRSLAPYPDPSFQQQQLWPAPTPQQSCGSRCGPSTSTTPLQPSVSPNHPSVSPLPQYQMLQPNEEQYYLQPNNSQPTLQTSQYVQDPTRSSCYDVASMIRSMNPHLGAELEAELGCADGGDCDVSNLRAFEVLDRVSGGGS